MAQSAEPESQGLDAACPVTCDARTCLAAIPPLSRFGRCPRRRRACRNANEWWGQCAQVGDLDPDEPVDQKRSSGAGRRPPLGDIGRHCSMAGMTGAGKEFEEREPILSIYEPIPCAWRSNVLPRLFPANIDSRGAGGEEHNDLPRMRCFTCGFSINSARALAGDAKHPRPAKGNPCREPGKRRRALVDRDGRQA